MMTNDEVTSNPGRWRPGTICVRGEESGGSMSAGPRAALVPGHDALPWVKFCRTAQFREAEALLRSMEETGRRAQILEGDVKRRGLPERSVAALRDAAHGHRVRSASHRKAVDVSDAVSSRDLGALASAGLRVAHGAKGGRYSPAGDRVQQRRAATDLPEIHADPFRSER